ncbi:PPP4R1 isoform 4 [Pan troglodytes]|uniref:Protein phosphatase 4 regulatory subunit 1 n=3 Tax=Homininae TaxID=207598 RepID=F8WAJ9_HUMAN|nr:protein phosphatase 4 regulatory subunit 1 [Homo sapiens]KAI4045559.1 protein phosphatase 4 regulatory subunit 1 [Homo sapiens]PNI16264.1 PPP4R1 isoform 4 [Pan troglodytes]
MADLSLLQEDLQEDADGSLDFVSQDEMLTPLGRLDKYAASENIFNRTNCESGADGTGASHRTVLSRKPAFNTICFFKILTTYCG